MLEKYYTRHYSVKINTGLQTGLRRHVCREWGDYWLDMFNVEEDSDLIYLPYTQFDIVMACLYLNILFCLWWACKTFKAAVVTYNFYSWCPRVKIVLLAPIS